MSGGFFRGTSADQDTRFSNKQAKLLKSKKFASELEILVDMTRVKMDVMRPWIAKRVTELIGFEDEVLINFIYGLLEGKAVNGKHVQISLTGFMERNTGKFMKELWVLLLSAQQNVSGVPQPFLDAKEEETKRRMAETDRIANEIHKNKEKEQHEAEKETTNMDGDGSFFREQKTGSKFHSRHDVGISGMQPEDEKDKSIRKGERMRSRVRHTPDSSNHSISPRRKHSASPSKSSGSKRKSRSRSRARSSRSPSVSFQGKSHSSPRQSVSPYRKHAYRRSPSPRHRSPYSRKRLTSYSTQYKGNSPRRNRSRTPVRYRSRSPYQHRSRRSWRSPVRYRSRTPLGRNSRSPPRKRSLSPMPRRLPSYRGRSPAFRRRNLQSPEHGSYLSPVPHRHDHDSSLSPRHGSESPAQHRRAYHKRSSTPDHEKSCSPQESKSPVHINMKKASPINTKSSGREKSRMHEKHSPAFINSPNSRADPIAENHRVTTLHYDSMKEKGLPFQKSPVLSDSSRGRSSDEERSSSPGILYKTRAEPTRTSSLNSPRKSYTNKPETNVSIRDAVEHAESRDDTDRRKKRLLTSELLHDTEDRRSGDIDGSRNTEDKKRGSDSELEANDMHPRKSDRKVKNGSLERRDEDNEKRKRKNSDKYETESDDQSSFDSYEERKEAKKRRKERKKLKKEDRRRRRDEKHLRRTEKLKSKSGIRNKHSDEDVTQQDSKVMDGSDTEMEQRKLEIELREKAIESLRAKKGLGN